jgi:ribosome-binding protein aMBF1 (putative translation factor)
MSSSVARAESSTPRIRCEAPRPRMAKAVLPDLTLREKRAEYGRILKRARELAGMNRDECARALGDVDPAQVTRWESGDENQQTWRYRQNPTLKAAYKLAQGEADGAVLELREVITLAQKVG